ncbi:MAG: DUF3460 family protein [Rhodocyclaceae bacterium]|jgi:hypothetical protein|nr:DUF3460 family protein [Rhodocyclaceae bacterium]
MGKLKGYESEYTKFMRAWLQQHPEQIDEQQRGRALWWDRGNLTPEELARRAAMREPQKAYYYDVN